MSRSQYHSPTGEKGLPYYSTLNAAARPFSMPSPPVKSYSPPRSALRPSAPAFIAPAATKVNPHYANERVTDTYTPLPFEQPWGNGGSMGLVGDAAGEFDCDFTDLVFGSGDLADFNNFDPATDDTWNSQYATIDPALSGDMALQHAQVSLPATLDDVLSAQQPQNIHGAAIKDATPAQLPHFTWNAGYHGDMAMQHAQVPHNAAAFNNDMVVRSLETAYDTAVNRDKFVQHPQTTQGAIINDDMFFQHPQVTRDGNLIGSMAVQHPHTSFAMSQLEHGQWAGNTFATMGKYPRSSIDNDFDFGLATTVAHGDDSSDYPTTPSLSYGVSSPEDDMRTDDEDEEDEDTDSEHDEDIDGDGETDDEYQPHIDTDTPNTSPNENASNTAVTTNKKNTRSNAKKAKDDAESPVVIQESSFSVKQRKANIVIAKQKTQTSLARRLGQHLSVTYNGGRIQIEGIYWKAPANDYTIPRTHAQKSACVQAIIAAIRNNQDCKEVSTTKSFENRWADGATYFSPEEILHGAWDIIETMIKIHTVGWTKQVFDPALREQSQKTMFCTFGERFHELVDLLTHSKRTCIDVLKQERFYTAIGNPWELNTRSSSNQTSNKTKGTTLKTVNAAKRKADEMEAGEPAGQGHVEVAAKAGEPAGQGNAEVAAQPQKRARKNARK